MTIQQYVSHTNVNSIQKKKWSTQSMFDIRTLNYNRKKRHLNWTQICRSFRNVCKWFGFIGWLAIGTNFVDDSVLSIELIQPKKKLFELLATQIKWKTAMSFRLHIIHTKYSFNTLQSENTFNDKQKRNTQNERE